jgi:hypothetical protein
MQKAKYRVWDNEKGEYFKPTYGAYEGKLEELLLSPSGRLSLRTYSQIYDCESMFPNRFIIEFYTGLKDKKVVNIYEGDIVDYKCGELKTRFVIVFRSGSFGGLANSRFSPMTDIIDGTGLIIIGNIHEHSYLLEK